jgi:DNA adenine methylase
VEPFFGGGAVFGWLQGTVVLPAHLNDINAELMSVLAAVRDDVDGFLDRVESLVIPYLELPSKDERKAFYYALRSIYWADPDDATLFVLMRLGFNGIWQTCADSRGLFGTPAGLLNHTKMEQVVKTDLVRQWSVALRGASITSGDYREMEYKREGSLIYLDPPYRGSFTTYGTGFDDDAQRSLVQEALGYADQGATVLLANRVVEGDEFFEKLLGDRATFHYFDVTYTAGRRKATADGFEAKPAREFLAVLS